ncbi:hypothetical protein HWV62_13996 [Athelia sp. TMB]|nr:hypothetical protein HWV62_13996 [Athelia sp. TMB]
MLKKSEVDNEGPAHIKASMYLENWLLQGKRLQKSKKPSMSSRPSPASLSPPDYPPSPSPPPIDIDGDYGEENGHANGSTQVTARASQIEQYRWHTQGNEPTLSSGDKADSDGKDESDLDSDIPSELDLDVGDESDNGDGVLTAWELLGDDFAREAHSLDAYQLKSSRLDAIEAFALKVQDHLLDKTCKKFPRVFRKHSIRTACQTRKQLQDLAGPKTLYVPLDCRNLHAPGEAAPASYDPLDLPMHSHEQFMAQAHEVQNAISDADEKKLSQKYSIKGVPLLSILSSLSFPHSFPFDFMHGIFENLLPNLLQLWLGQFKDVKDEEGEGCRLAPTLLEAIGDTCGKSKHTIPSAFGAPTPNIASEMYRFTAENWSFWALHLAPSLLQGCFHDARFHKHFVELVKLLNICLQFEISDDNIFRVRVGMIKWVEDYERASVGLLGLSDGALLQLTSTCHQERPPYVNLSNHISDVVLLSALSLMYDLNLSFALSCTSTHKTLNNPKYPKSTLLGPTIIIHIPDSLSNKIAISLATQYNTTVDVTRKYIPQQVSQWGKVSRSEGGDTIHAQDLVNLYEKDRDTSYTQLCNIVEIDILVFREVGTQQRESLLLAVVRKLKTEPVPNAGGPVQYKDSAAGIGGLDMVDLATLQCCVGRVLNCGSWVIIDCSGPHAQAAFNLNMLEAS